MTTNRQKAAGAKKTTQSSKKKIASNETLPLAEELLQLNDDFAEFSDISAFLCNAFAITLAEHEWLNKEIISGARLCSNWLYFRTCELKNDIRQVNAHCAEMLHEKSNAK
ncbi:MAG: hypothetical protein KJ795_02095 [Gammaproteobacteria bacterium]|nr:hypothetical protein [Gammaproteobacteria bacterium]MBU1776992.1 hypothetical protein [Gammaproteobacteria bacterium]